MSLSHKKIESPKIGYTCFFVLPYFEPFDFHATSNFSIYRYMYKKMIILREEYLRTNLVSYCVLKIFNEYLFIYFHLFYFISFIIFYTLKQFLALSPKTMFGTPPPPSVRKSQSVTLLFLKQ